MAFDSPTRNRLQSFVRDARKILEEEFTRQLQNDYGLDPVSGQVTALENLRHLNDSQHETARILRDTLAHYAASQGGETQAVLDRIVREQAFTVLNRLAALRMAEARGLMIESVGNGYQSKGFQLYSRLAGSGLGETGDAYRIYLFSVYDEMAQELPSLFQRYTPQGRMFPREAALLQLLGLINASEIAELWAEDETIGWIYQYFNSKEERKKMRDESAAPRNSRELAVRNQFFTPRYVVEFLTDNTLGRIWYEMTQGDTQLKEQCRYLVRRPTEIFLQPGEAAPEQAPQENLSQEELLQQPVYIPHRPLKDPRELRMLDPACGSMHFGLYAFDLFEAIYAEAWELAQAHPEQPEPSFAEFQSFVASFADQEAYLKEVPRLIIEHNIHGIDIDPRAVQIASLALWLRAQKSWHTADIKAKDRPLIQRSQIVCAEPMPGEVGLLNEFIEKYLSDTPERQLLGQLVRHIFEAMQLAGEAGSLLKIEEEIAKLVTDARAKWEKMPQSQQLSLFDETVVPIKAETGLKVKGVTKGFWERAEERIYDALKLYAEQAEQGQGYQRRLFAQDAAQGFSFIELCRKRYDVVLMNPPFGDASKGALGYLTKTYPRTKNDLYGIFTERMLQVLRTKGHIGVISSRTGFFLTTFKKWREELLLQESKLNIMADLGAGVLDAAMVETAAYCLEKTV